MAPWDDWSSKVDLDLDRAELERLRWYLEDSLEYPIDPAPKIAAQVEQRLVELGRDLFGQVFPGPRGDPAVGSGRARAGPALGGRASISGSSGLPALMARIGPNPVEPATTGIRAG